MALLLPEVPAPVLRRVRRGIDQAFFLGTRLLRRPKRAGEEPPSGSQGLGLQVDQDHLSVLADED